MLHYISDFFFFFHSLQIRDKVSHSSVVNQGEKNKELIKLSWIIVCKLYMLFQFFGVGIQSYLNMVI